MCTAHLSAAIKANPPQGGDAKLRASIVIEVAGLPNRQGGEKVRCLIYRPNLAVVIVLATAFAALLRGRFAPRGGRIHEARR